MSRLNEKIMVRIDDDTKTKLEEKAEEIGLRVSTYSRMKLKESLNEAEA